MDDLIYVLEFTIPRDLELAESLQLKNKGNGFEIELTVLERVITITNIDSNNTTAILENKEDRYGDNAKTKLRAEFKIDANFFNDGLDVITLKDDSELIKKQADDILQTKGKRHQFFITSILKLVNQIIETHQYVNDKYYIFPIDFESLQDIIVTLPTGNNMLINLFGGAKFTANNPAYHQKIVANTEKVSKFINQKEDFFEPLRIMGYAVELGKRGLFRVAITEAQSAIEHLLTKKYVELTGNDFPNISTGKKSRFPFFHEKLIELGKVTNSWSYSNFPDSKTISDAKNMRNDIIHGKETPTLDAKLCKKYVLAYKKLFDEIYLI